tara:strand:- start:3477 stop:4016 length:540 start_codon:yes stop_codon:yes gene_type:complete
MIERRHKGFVIDKGLVPVANVCESIGTGKSMDEILRMYPTLGMADVFEAVEFYALNTQIPANMSQDQLLKLVNVGGEDIVLEVTNINQVVFLKLVELGKRYYRRVSNFATCMNNGLRISCLENIIAAEEDRELDNDLHELVRECLMEETPGIFENPAQTKEDLDYEEYIQTKEKYETKV